jgi:hypothetical protein
MRGSLVGQWGKPLSRQVERDTDRDAAQGRMDRVESIGALVQVLDGSSDMARFVESLRGEFVCQENAGNRDQNQERDSQSDVTLAIQAVPSGNGAVWRIGHTDLPSAHSFNASPL